MDACREETSEILKFYAGKTILLTGATGVVGRMVLEKLLRTCKDIHKIHILVRPKKGKSPEQRMHELFEGLIMDSMKEQNPNYLEKLSLIDCDLEKSNCGLSNESIKILISEVDIVIHCAATVRFDASIRDATHINLRATKYLLDLASEMVNLEVFLYVSTAFSYCNRRQIKEKFYHSPIKPEALIKLVEMIDTEKLDRLTPTLIEDWPNTYVYTKAVTEGLIAERAHKLPVGILRPSIVVATSNEPIPGWIDNVYGPSAIVCAAFVGVMRSIHGDENNKADLVPADFVVNAIIVAAYDSSKKWQTSNGLTREIPIYNYCTHPKKPLTWKYFMEGLFREGFRAYASPKLVWYPSFTIRKCVYADRIVGFLQQRLPAIIIDSVLYVFGKERWALRMMEKVTQITSILSYFVVREWDFEINNTIKLWNSISTKDKALFNFNMETINWPEYTEIYLRGVRIHILKDPLETVPEGLRKVNRYMYVHYSLVVLFYIFVFYVIYSIVSSFVGILLY